mmetsp:Transcript_18311/g.36968  ORF Transcript_18311/g.36968 Transcript_18311/m.36968 type:complete len:101 (-) Transcript_18311:891-1193(-)
MPEADPPDHHAQTYPATGLLLGNDLKKAYGASYPHHGHACDAGCPISFKRHKQGQRWYRSSAGSLPLCRTQLWRRRKKYVRCDVRVTVLRVGFECRNTDA